MIVDAPINVLVGHKNVVLVLHGIKLFAICLHAKPITSRAGYVDDKLRNSFKNYAIYDGPLRQKLTGFIIIDRFCKTVVENAGKVKH